MKKEDINLLIKDLCARIPYGTIVRHECEDEGKIHYTDGPLVRDNKDGWDIITTLTYGIVKYGMKPYLRPMSSMTEEEREEFRALGGVTSYSPQHDTWAISAFSPEAYDWLNAHYFDYRGLIEKGLALKAPEEMYTNKPKNNTLIQ